MLYKRELIYRTIKETLGQNIGGVIEKFFLINHFKLIVNSEIAKSLYSQIN